MATRIALLLLTCVCTCVVQCRITHRQISLDGRDHFRVELPFGFDSRGEIHLTVTNLEVYGPRPNMTVDLSQFGFFLASTSTSMLAHVDERAHDKCYLQDESLIKLMDFSEWKEEVNEKKEDQKISSDFLFSDPNVQMAPGEYVLYYAKCNQTVSVKCDVRVVMFNKRLDGERDYLSVGERPLPTIYLLMFLAFSTLAVTWAKVCYTERRYIHGIHYLMFCLVVLRSIVYFTLAGMYHDDRVTGSPEGWNVAYYVFTFLRGVMFFVVIVLIGTGWSYLRPFIGENEKKVLVVVIPLQIFANIAIIILAETSPARTSFMTLSDLLHLVDIICCCAILFPIVWSIKHLREGAESDGKAAANVEKLTLFRQFYVLVVVYIYFTRIIVFLLDNTLPYDYKWAGKLASELATFAFYVIVGMKFRPHGENAYLKLESDVAL